MRRTLDLDQAAVAVLAATGADALGNDGALGVAAQMDHLGAGVGLLRVVGERDRIELADRIVAHQHARGILPGDRKRLVQGKRVSVRVDLGGRRILKKKTIAPPLPPTHSYSSTIIIHNTT